MGSAVSWDLWDNGLIPGLTQWIADLVLPQLQPGLYYGSDLIPGLGTPYALGWPKKKKKERERERTTLEFKEISRESHSVSVQNKTNYTTNKSSVYFFQEASTLFPA